MAEHPAERSAQRRGDGLLIALVMILAAAWAGFHAWNEQRDRTHPLDLDGWGHLLPPLKESGGSFAVLFSQPSLWKGPVVPFLFGLSYWVAPSDYSVLVMNAALFALSAGILFDAFRRLGVGRWFALGAIVLWIGYLPHALVFGYYYAEPVLAFLSAVLFWLASRLTIHPGSGTAFVLGIVGGVLVLARAPFLLVIVGLPLVLWRPLAGLRAPAYAAYAAGFLVVFAPWPARNYLVEREWIPFTTEGGKILFQGTYLPGDDVRMDELRKLPAFREIEAGEGESAVEQYHYWRSRANAQIREQPVAQLALCVRKALRFWTYLPAHSWVPSWKTALVMFLTLPLALLGAYRGRRTPLVHLCVLWVCGLWLFHSIVHSELRYNFPVMPMLFALAALGLRQLIGTVRPARTRQLLPDDANSRDPDFTEVMPASAS